MYKLVYSKQSLKDSKKLKQAKLKEKTQKILDEITLSPLSPSSKKLSGNLSGCYSRRITIQHRLVYEVFEDIKIIRVLAMWTHYGVLRTNPRG